MQLFNDICFTSQPKVHIRTYILCNWLSQLLGATTHEGLDKRMEALLQWEREWLTLAFDMVSV